MKTPRSRGDEEGIEKQIDAAILSVANPISKPRISPRLCRLINALMVSPCTVRELIDEIPSNNPAAYIQTLRNGFGVEVPCSHIKFETIDGIKSWYGLYRLTPSDRQTLTAVVDGKKTKPTV